MTEPLISHGFQAQTAEINIQKEPAVEILSDQEISNFLTAFGNNEAKTITYILLGDGNTFTPRVLARKILDLQGQTKGWDIKRGSIQGYCRNLLSRGLVENGYSPDSYRIEEHRREFGISLAGLLLEFSERHNIPLIKLWGATNSSYQKGISEADMGGEEVNFKKKTSPLTTYRILLEIVKSSSLPIREIDVENAIRGESQISLSEHFKRLSELGIIEYKAIKPTEKFAYYMFGKNVPQKEPPTYRAEKELTGLVFDVFNNHKDRYLGAEEIYDLLPEEIKERRKRNSLLAMTSGIIYFLSKHKYLEGTKFHHGKYSEISLNEKQREILKELLDIFDRLKNQDKETLEKGKRFAQEITGNPDRLFSSLRRAKETSSNANRSSRLEIRKQIGDIIFENPRITNEKIRLILGKMGKKLGIRYISTITTAMVKDGSLDVDRKGSEGMFSFSHPDIRSFDNHR